MVSHQQRTKVSLPGTRRQQKRTAVKKVICRPKRGPAEPAIPSTKVVSHFGIATYKDASGTLVSGEVLFIGPPGTLTPPAGTCITLLCSAATEQTAPEGGRIRQGGPGPESDVHMQLESVPQGNEKRQANQDPEGGENKQAGPAPESGKSSQLARKEKQKKKLRKWKEKQQLKKMQKAIEKGQSRSDICPSPPQCSQPMQLQSLRQRQPHTAEEAELAGAEGTSTANDRKKRRKEEQGNQPAKHNLVRPPPPKLDAYPAPPARLQPQLTRAIPAQPQPSRFRSPPPADKERSRGAEGAPEAAVPRDRRRGQQVKPVEQDPLHLPASKPDAFPAPPGRVLPGCSNPVQLPPSSRPSAPAEEEELGGAAGAPAAKIGKIKRTEQQVKQNAFGPPPPRPDAFPAHLTQPPPQQQQLQTRRAAAPLQRFSQPWAPPLGMPPIPGLGQPSQPAPTVMPTAVKREPEEEALPLGQLQLLVQQQAEGQQQTQRTQQADQAQQEEQAEPEQQQSNAGAMCLWRPKLNDHKDDEIYAAEQKPLSEPPESLRRPGQDSGQVESSSSASSDSEPDEGQPAASAPDGIKSITVGRATSDPVAPRAAASAPATRGVSKRVRRSKKHCNKSKRWSSKEGETLVRIVNDTEYRRATLKTRKMDLDWERVGKFFGRTAVGVQQHYYGCSKRAKADAPPAASGASSGGDG